ncbi:MAG: arsenic transporter, partial [Gaiellaceae bacterium]
LSAPALPVLGVGIAAVALRRVRPRLDVRVLGSLFVLAVALGTLARHWSGPGDLIEGASRWSTAGIGALAAVLVNNLPAAALLSAQAPHHARALLIGLDLGPNLAVTGSLSAYLWLRAARAVGAEPSLRTYSLVGLALVPLSVAVSLAAISL